MRKFATRLLPLAMYAALVVVPTIALAQATTNNREEERAQERIQKSSGFNDLRSAGQNSAGYEAFQSDSLRRRRTKLRLQAVAPFDR